MKYLNRNIALELFKLTNGHPIHTFLSGSGVILLFHRVVERSESVYNAALEISPERLERILNYFIKLGYEFISLDAMIERLSEKRQKRFVVVTFDDGYKDNFTLAYPIFKKFKIPFTIYASLGLLERKAVVWWYLLEDVVKHNSELSFTYDSFEYSYQCQTAIEKNTAFDSIRKFIINASSADIEQRLNAVFKPYFSDIYEKTKELALSWEEIKLLSEDPLVTIGNHTNKHLALSKISEETIIDEINTAQLAFIEKLSLKTRHLAYPFGSRNEVNQIAAEIVKKLGYSTAVTTIQGCVFSGHLNQNNNLLIPRYLVCNNTSKYDINVRLNGVYGFLRNNYSKLATL